MFDEKTRGQNLVRLSLQLFSIWLSNTVKFQVKNKFMTCHILLKADISTLCWSLSEAKSTDKQTHKVHDVPTSSCDWGDSYNEILLYLTINVNNEGMRNKNVNRNTCILFMKTRNSVLTLLYSPGSISMNSTKIYHFNFTHRAIVESWLLTNGPTVCHLWHDLIS
jgi:hypothetical protein